MHAAARPAQTVPASTRTNPPSATSPATAADNGDFPNDEQTPPKIITIPAPAPSPASWEWKDRITWGAQLVLVLFAYVGIMMALSTLRKIDRQTKSVEAAAIAAAESAHAALLNAQAIVDSGRPWLLATVKPSPDVENSFSVIATNHGRSPARIVGTLEQITFAVDETHLPRTPEYLSNELTAPLVPIILLPGESAEIKPFSREDLNAICDSEERIRSVENWEEKVYIYGKVAYRDLVAPPDKMTHETAWCCWYIHGRQKSGLVFAGPAEYNAHT
ncbi:MAG: hypothetical protein WBQ94_03990 [Terracidiphilus sp.]